MLHISSNTGVFKKTIKCLNAPTLSYVVNSTGQNITLELPAADGTPLIIKGDIIKITEEGFGIFPSIVEGFETFDPLDSTMARGWAHNNVGTGVSNVLGNNPASGVNSLQLTNPSTGNYGGTFKRQGILLPTSGGTLRWSFKAKGSAGGGPTGVFRITFANPGNVIDSRGFASGQPSAQAQVTISDFAPTLTTSYQVFSGSVAVPAGYKWAFVEIYSNGNGAVPTFYFDDVNVTTETSDSPILYTGIVEDLPDNIDQTVDHQITLAPLAVEIADADFTQNYTVATDVAQMIRDAVARTVHCTATTTTVPNTGILRIFNFNEKSPLYVLNAAIKMAGANYVWFVDELGQVFFGPSTSGITYSVKTRVDAPVRRYTAPITNQKNYVKAFGGILPNTTTKISAVYDTTGSSAIGRRALMPPLQFPNLLDQTTLNSIVNTIGVALDQPQVTVVLELPNAGQRINLARVGGANVRYFEPDKDDLPETSPGSGTYGPAYVIVQVDITGPVQRITARGIAFSVDDFVNEINENLSRVSTDAITNLPLTPGQVVGATTGGPSTPSSTAWFFSAWSTGIENIAQVNNAYIIAKWTPNNANENISRYEIRYSKTADGNYFTESALMGVVDGGGRGFIKIAGLLPGTSYTLEIRAINYLGIPGPWSSTQAVITGVDSSAPATPTGVTAVQSIRGALLSWNGNTEPDLKGYQVQVSIAGAGYVLVTPDASLITSLSYIAPPGTVSGVTLAFQVRAIDWSGNISAWTSAASTTTGSVGSGDVGFIVGGGNLVANSKFDDNTDLAGISPYSRQNITSSYDTVSAPLFGTYAFKVQHTAAGDAYFFMALPGIAGASLNGKKVTLSFYAKADTLQAVYGGAPALQDNTGHYIVPDGSPALTITTSWTRYVLLFTLGSSAFTGTDSVHVVMRPGSDLATNNIYFNGVQLEIGDTVTAYAPRVGEILTGAVGTNSLANLAVTTAKVANAAITTAQIASASITTALIANAAINSALIADLAVDNAKIANMVVDKLLAGNLQVFGTMTTGGLQTATSGARVVLDSTSLRAFDGSATNWGAPSGAGVTAEIKNDGTAFFKGAIRSSTVYASEVATSGTMGTTGAGAGFKLSGQFLDFFTEASVSEGTRFWYAADSVTPFTLAGLLAAGTMKFARGSANSNTEIITTSGGPVVASAMAIASFKPATTIALRGVKGAFTSNLGGSVQPPFGQATASGNLLIAWVSANTATPPSIATATSGWVRAVVANATNAESTIWYKLNCGAGETAPTFTATLQAPGGGATDTATSIINTSPGFNSNANNMSIASFSPAVSGTPITLRSLGAIATGSNASVSPAYGIATASGDLLVAWVSGSDHTPGIPNQTLGQGGAATFTFNFSLASSDNIIFTGASYSMPAGGGYVSSITIYMGGYSANVNTIFCIWNASTGALIAQSSNTTVGVGLSIRTLSAVGSPFIAAGTALFVGFWRQQNQDAQWGVAGTGTFNYLTNQSSNTSVAGYSACGSPYTCGNIQAYFTFTPSTPTTAITTAASGWVKAVDAANGDEETQIWYKPNCGASEAAPTFTSANGGSPLHAQLAEFTGAKTSSVLDRTGTLLQGAASATMVAANSVADTQAGDLVLYASRWSLVSAGTATWTDSLNTAISQAAGNTGGSSLTRHSDFAYGIVSVPAMHAQVAEFTGALTAGALDQTGTANQTNANTGLSVIASVVDVGNNDLVVTTGRWVQSVNGTASWLDTYNNSTPVSAGNSGALNTDQHSNYAYGIISTSPSGTVLQITNFVGLEAITTGTSLGRGLITTQYSSDAASANFSARKARGSQASPLTVSNGDMIAAYFASAYDGTNWYNTGRLTFDVNGAVSTGVIPTEFNVRLNPGSGEFIALGVRVDRSVAITGPLSIPAVAGGGPATSGYGSIPIKFDEQTVSGASSFSTPTLPTTFRHIEIVFRLQASGGGGFQECGVRVSGDSGTHYGTQRLQGNAATSTSSELQVSTSGTLWFIGGNTGQFSTGRIFIPDYKGGSSSVYIWRVDWQVYTSNVAPGGGPTGAILVGSTSHVWYNAATITSVTLFPLAGTFTGVITTYLWP